MALGLGGVTGQMHSFKQQMFQQYASEALQELIENYKKVYEPKKEDRFNYKGITYEIGPARIVEEGIEYEISSKIPHDELPERAGISKYFQEVRRIVSKARKRPYSIDMENIVREMGANEIKERDYVKLRYRYTMEELCSEEEVMKEAKELARNPGKGKVPAIPGVATLAGRLILAHVRQKVVEETRVNVQLLIDANEAVREKMRGANK